MNFFESHAKCLLTSVLFHSLPWNCSPQLRLTLFLNLSLLQTYFLLLTLPRYLSQTCQWTSIRATVVSQMGCKDTDFFLTSKFFRKNFSKKFTFSFTIPPNVLIFNNIITTEQYKTMIINRLQSNPAVQTMQGFLSTH